MAAMPGAGRCGEIGAGRCSHAPLVAAVVRRWLLR